MASLQRGLGSAHLASAGEGQETDGQGPGYPGLNDEGRGGDRTTATARTTPSTIRRATRTRDQAKRSISDEFRDIVLPRPLPDPPEYARELHGWQAKGEDAEGGHVADGRSVAARLREGLVMYADTWRRKDGGSDGQAEDVARGLGTSQPSSAEEASRLLEEVQFGSATVQDIVRNKYAIRARAFQLAVKEFVVGWHETRHRR